MAETSDDASKCKHSLTAKVTDLLLQCTHCKSSLLEAAYELLRITLLLAITHYFRRSFSSIFLLFEKNCLHKKTDPGHASPCS